MEKEIKKEEQVKEVTKETKKKFKISDKKILIGLLIFLVLNILVYSFLDAYLTKRMELEETSPYQEQISDIKDDIAKLRNNVQTVKKTTTCEEEQQDEESNEVSEVSIDIDFYDEFTDPIEIASICTECTIREVGEVRETSTNPEDLFGYKYIVAVFEVESYESMWGGNNGIARLLTNDDYSKFYFFKEDSVYEIQKNFNQELVYNEDYIPTLNSSLLPGELNTKKYVESNDNLYYNRGYNTYFTPLDTGDLTLEEIDEYEGRTIYVNSEDPNSYYILSNEQFYYSLNFQPSITLDLEWNDPLPITWEGEEENSYSYDYGYDACSDVGLRTEDISKDELEITGEQTNTEQPIYEYLDKEHEDIKKLYEEDYLKYSAYFDEEGNYNEDLTPMTYEEFVQEHPIIFWEDETGRMIKFYNKKFILVGGCAKPIVYLYPEIKREITVKVLPTNGDLTFTYPEYNGYWDVQATKDGVITDSKGNTHEYLWWESKSDQLEAPEEGFVVKYSNLGIFFDNILTKAGFITPEINDFKEFWVPTMQSEYSPYFKISFLQNKEVDRIARLLIDPNPNTEIRLFMIYERLDSYEDVTPQDICQTPRTGFVVTEWGGTRR